MTDIVGRSSCSKQRRAKEFGFGLWVTSGGVNSKTQPRALPRRGNRESAFSGFRIVESVTDVIVIDDSNSNLADPISGAFKHTADIDVDVTGDAPKASCVVQVGSCTVSKKDLCNDD